MPQSSPPEHRSLFIAAFILACFGWLGLYLLLNTTLPTLGPRWLLFFLVTVAVTGTTLPFVWLLHRRFRAEDPAPRHVLMRHGTILGLYASLCLWLQINRSLSLPLAALLVAILIALEGLLRLIELSRRRSTR